MFRKRSLMVFACVLVFGLLLFVPSGLTAEEKSTDDGQTIALIMDKTKKAPDVQTLTTYNGMTNKQKALGFANSLVSYYLQYDREKGPRWLRTTDIQFSFMENHKPIFSCETLQPFGAITGKDRLWFWQGRYAYASDSSGTANLGLGWRKLSPDKNNIIGFNAFYDYGFEYNLRRVGLGMEYFNKLAEFRLNAYQGVSNNQLASVTYAPTYTQYSYIRAVDGMDYEVGTSFHHLPWMKVYAGGYYWDKKYSNDEKGYRLKTAMQLSPRLHLELGYSHSNLSRGSYAQVKYQLADIASPTKTRSATASQANNISDKLLQHVTRQNDIKTETYNSTIVANTVIHVTDKDFYTLPLLPIVIDNGAGTMYRVTTDTAGNAVIPLPAGSYSIYIEAMPNSRVNASIKDQSIHQVALNLTSLLILSETYRFDHNWLYPQYYHIYYTTPAVQYCVFDSTYIYPDSPRSYCLYGPDPSVAARTIDILLHDIDWAHLQGSNTIPGF